MVRYEVNKHEIQKIKINRKSKPSSKITRTKAQATTNKKTKRIRAGETTEPSTFYGANYQIFEII